mmetsp:Transcript_15000/g.52220  ORF Transcript_15000/g.52220 Transcript_15000/m.52220 type:complete len:345 (-) Transcript_15000:1570-2604(-)
MFPSSGRRSLESYERKAAEEDNELGALSQKLIADLQSHVHLIVLEPVLSAPWCRMADLVQRIAFIADMEAKLPKESANATLWECEELALRHILEEGKLNLCLRNLVEFRTYTRQADGVHRAPSTRGDAELAHRDAELARRDDDDDGSGDAKLEESPMMRLDKFERGMGSLLRNAWQHVEAIQTTDLPLLLKHISDVLGDAMHEETGRARMRRFAQVDGDLKDRQEVLVLHYLRGLTSHIDDIMELRFMKLVRDERTVERVVDFLDAHHAQLRKEDLLVAAQALSALVDSEDFQTYEGDYCTSSCGEKLAAFRELFLEQFTDDYEARKTIQPLLRYVQDCRYKYK